MISNYSNFYTKIMLLGVLCSIIIKDNSCERISPSELELPRPSDLPILMRALKKITNYAIKNSNAVNINFMFGIFLSKVNLEASGLAGFPLARDEASILEEVLRECDVILNDFQRIGAARHRSFHSRETLITSLFVNTTRWAASLPRYSSALVQSSLHRFTSPGVPGSLPVGVPGWDAYVAMVLEYEAWVPSPNLSDECLEMLATSPEGAPSAPRRCRASETCVQAIDNGTWFGYALTHRLLLVLSSRLSRRCYLRTPATDERLTRRLCAQALSEANYISSNHYLLRDLFMEQISLCSLLGNIEFLRRPWLQQVMSWQQPVGCYHQSYVDYPPNSNRQLHGKRNSSKEKEKKTTAENHVTFEEGRGMKKVNTVGKTLAYGKTRNEENSSGKTIKNERMKNEEKEMKRAQEVEECEGHVTAVAAATLSAAVRFIVQYYYNY